MTGYASKCKEFEDYTILVEIKSRNNKFLEVKFRLPSYLEDLENKLRQIVKSYVKRGKVDILVNVTAKQKLELSLIKSILEKYYGIIKRIQDEMNIHLQMSLSEIISLKSLINPYDEVATLYIPEKIIEEMFIDTVKAFQQSRYAEGENTKKDLLEYIQKISTSINKIKDLYPPIIERYKDQLKERICELIEGKMDDARIMMEVGIFANKVDISEEISRIKGHLQNMIATIKVKGICGRELDFIIQEINRETNTIGSKVPDYSISEEVVNMKSCLEKIKEQVRNIE